MRTNLNPAANFGMRMAWEISGSYVYGQEYPPPLLPEWFNSLFFSENQIFRGASWGNWLGPQRGTSFKYRIIGITKDAAGAVLGGCMVKLYRTTDDVYVDYRISDAGGYYEFGVKDITTSYYLIAYKATAPDVFGTTVNNLAGV
jgi:hypothetical protein